METITTPKSHGWCENRAWCEHGCWCGVRGW
jgi:hypothetical protein